MNSFLDNDHIFLILFYGWKRDFEMGKKKSYNYSTVLFHISRNYGVIFFEYFWKKLKEFGAFIVKDILCEGFELD